MKINLAIAGTAAALAAAGCGGSASNEQSGGSAGDSGHAASSFPKAAAREAAKQALLTVADLPTGWSTSPNKSSSGGEQFRAEMMKCLHAPAGLFSASSQSASADSPDFNDPQGQAQVSETVGITTAARAATAFTVLKQPRAAGCISSAINGYVKDQLAAQAITQGATIGSATVGNVNFPKIGDDTVALRVSLPVSAQGLTLDVYLDLVFVRYRNASVNLSFEDEGSAFDSATAASITRKAFKHLKAVNIPSA